MRNQFKILFIGDIVGKSGRKAAKQYLTDNKEKYNFIIANVENASHGFGLTKKNHDELLSYGINCFTSGNHIWDKKEIYNYISEADKLLRPINYPSDTLGTGSRIFEVNGEKIGVINVLGRVFMQPVDSPWQILKEEIENIKKTTSNIIIDFHAEATAEKLCLARYLSELGVSALIGTHTHVQTADETIINGMAYITDAGFCGSADSIIGMDYQTSLKRLSTLLPERYEIADTYPAQINAVEISIIDGKATEIKRIFVMREKELEVNVENDG